MFTTLDNQVAKGYDMINLKNKFPFKWDKIIFSNNKTLIDNKLGYDYPYLENSSEDGLVGESIIFLKNNKIVHHEDSKYSYRLFDKVDGGFNFAFYNYNKIYCVDSDSAKYTLKILNAKQGRIILLIPKGVRFTGFDY
ncbi:hypothetical protein SAMN05421847_2872 [Halpernia humi]|uniref:Uncharacterized protein n=1 Tax=Halpernia humi TaxID=493375 RepID=A0A1H6BG35_9FLAO|nr:hypothetical protein [Halpernia humi]SEG59719.1 hypothetical protein SAMN05421847_2872 [Halpernia humi]